MARVMARVMATVYIGQHSAQSAAGVTACKASVMQLRTAGVGTMVRTPLDSIAGLNEPVAVWPFIAG